jgi:hypothetical protein
MKFNYRASTSLPSAVRSFTYGFEGWIVGGAAKYLLGLTQEPPRDYDIVIPLHRWHEASLTIPKGSRTNSFGGIKFVSDMVEIDVWGDDIGHYFANSDFPSNYGVYLPTWTYIESHKGQDKS